jgi:hypothetical protein
MQLICPERIALLAEYINITQEHAMKAQHLSGLAGKANPVVFSEALAESEAALQKCEQARLAFRSHKAEHGC